MTRPGACRGLRRGRRPAAPGHRRARPAARVRRGGPRSPHVPTIARPSLEARGTDGPTLTCTPEAPDASSRDAARRAKDVSDSATVNGRPTIEGSRAHGRAETSGQVTTTTPRSERHGRSRASSSSAALARSEDQTAPASGPRWCVAAARRSTRTRWASSAARSAAMRSRIVALPPTMPTAPMRPRCRKNHTRSRSTRPRCSRASRTRSGAARLAPSLRLRAQSRSRICRSRREAWSCSSRTCAASFSPRRWPRTARSCSVSWASCSSSGRPRDGSRSVALRHRSRASSTDALPRGTASSRSSSESRAP